MSITNANNNFILEEDQSKFDAKNTEKQLLKAGSPL